MPRTSGSEVLCAGLCALLCAGGGGPRFGRPLDRNKMNTKATRPARAKSWYGLNGSGTLRAYSATDPHTAGTIGVTYASTRFTPILFMTETRWWPSLT